MSDYTPKHIDPEINQRIGELFLIARGFCICEGEAQELACKQFGKRLDKFDTTEIDTFRTWIKSNWYRKTQILEPVMHEQLMKSNDIGYSTWFKTEEKKHQIAPEYIK
jgi:antibiotic biosynthesis monooxygenase (ABM) superfamily enzyme